MDLFDRLEGIAAKPAPFEFYTSPFLWNDPHISKGMLEAHLDPSRDLASFRSDSIDGSVQWIAERFDVSSGTKLCDFGCGPGLWTTRFAARGASVTGIDLSARSLHYARTTAEELGLNIRYIEGDYLNLDLSDEFDLVTLIYSDFSVLSPQQRTVLFGTFRRVLKPSGVLLFDVASAASFRDARGDAGGGAAYELHPAGGFFSPEPHHVITHHFRYDDLRLLCDKHTIVTKGGERSIYVWNQCYDVDSITSVLRKEGFRVAETYSDFKGGELTDDSRTIAVVAGRSRDEAGS